MRHPSTSSSSTTAAGGGGGGGSGGKTNTSTTTPCCSKVGLKRGPWTPEEDEVLANYINKEGEGRWRTMPKRAGLLRCGKSCRLRWMNYLRPNVKRGQIAPDEEDLILRLHRLLGNRWSLIAGRIPGRTDNEIKNYWNTHLSKKLISQGIDPRTHKPLNPDSPAEDDNKNKLSSSKFNQNLMPYADQNIVTPSLELEPVVSSNRIPVMNKGNGYYYQGSNQMLANPNPNLPNPEFSGLGLVRSINNGVGNEEDDEVNYCTDDVFSSFLNSLINEDGFNSIQHQAVQQQQQQLNGIVPCGSSDPLIISSTPTPPQNFTFGAGWDIAPIMSSGSALNHNEQLKRFHDQVDKKF
ncbi:hypothetical protein RHMOL_Rhmol01G0247700 [Rhododendron molle]|uniref:Uncharacterized protein n=1 Tax=Rhododendron molle TaxID=49168 RepID=A0ACC0Q6E1_RHOML|nr:hypothetical protein RHMOL_Rhmol01G0247700 [Rhododendron molle]